ncbi:MAG TPA: hypothetical protein VH328_00670, partial [Burkholderiaceae bacterium]|nr:hypothetical protein [Burkholderiaceae bacterium]
MNFIRSHGTRGVAAVVVGWAITTACAQAAGISAEVPADVPARLPPPAPSAGYDRCEEAVARAVRDMRGLSAQALRFEPAGHAQDMQGTRLAIQGTGHYLRDGRTPVSIRYSCAYDAESGTTSGVLFHESDAAPAP